MCFWGKLLIKEIVVIWLKGIDFVFVNGVDNLICLFLIVVWKVWLEKLFINIGIVVKNSIVIVKILVVVRIIFLVGCFRLIDKFILMWLGIMILGFFGLI